MVQNSPQKDPAQPAGAITTNLLVLKWDGYKYSLETQAARAERRIIELGEENAREEALLLGVNPALAALLIGPGGNRLALLEKTCKKMLFIRGKEEIPLPDVRVLAAGDKEKVRRAALPLNEGDELQVEVADMHANNPSRWDCPD